MFDNATLRMMLKEHGTTITLRKVARSAYNPDSGTMTPTNTDYSVKAYFYNFIPNQITGDNVQFDTRRVVVDPILTNGSATPKPEVSDVILGIGEDAVNVVRVSKIMSGSKVMCYLLHTDG